MRKNRKEMIRRVRRRLKGAAALLLALVITMTMLPGVKAKAGFDYRPLESGHSFYFVVYENEGLFCDGLEGIAADVYTPLSYSDGDGESNGIFRKYFHYLEISDHSKLTELNSFNSGGETYNVSTDHEATVYCGNVKSDDGHVLQMQLDGTDVAANTGAGADKKGSFTLPEGKYEVVFDKWNNNKLKINFNTIIESITLTPDPLNITTTDDPYQLQTKPAAAQKMVKWASSDEKIATVDADGKVTPVGVGEAKITATYTKDENISGSCVVKVAKGEIKTDVTQDDKAPNASEVTGLDSDLANSVMTADEKAMADAGQKTTLTLEMSNKDGQVANEEKNLVESELKKVNSAATVGMYFDISLILKIGANYQRLVTEMGNKAITVKFEIPQNLRAAEGVNRTFYLMHIHQGVAKQIASTKSDNMQVTLNQLSTFALAYSDETGDESGNTGFYSGLKITQKKGKIKVSWDKTEGVSKYGLFITYCGKDYPKKAVKTTKNNSVTVKKINGKKIDFTRNLKIYVEAFDNNGASVGKSISGHIAGKNSTKKKNPKSISVSNKNLTLSTGATSKIQATVKMEKGDKKAFKDDHVAKLRYRSTDVSIAKVDKNGKVTAVGAGNCQIYVYAQNGLAVKVFVTVN